jgi:hypothetical protein
MSNGYSLRISGFHVISDVGAEARHEREHFRVGGGHLTKALGRVRYAPESCSGRPSAIAAVEGQDETPCAVCRTSTACTPWR